jgi:hypothetical protein
VSWGTWQGDSQHTHTADMSSLGITAIEVCVGTVAALLCVSVWGGGGGAGICSLGSTGVFIRGRPERGMWLCV